jgi:transposase
MMSRQKPVQDELFEAPKDLGARVPPDHLLRRVNEVLDLEYIYDEVADRYGAVGNESVPPPTIMRMMLLLILYNVPAERQLFRDLPMRIDWLWFLGYGLSSKLPGHSVLSKARRRWGQAAFERLFVRIVSLCMKANLIDGREVLMDSSLIDANASIDSLFRAQKIADAAMNRLDEPAEEKPKRKRKGKGSGPEGEQEAAAKEPKYRSTTDPDATGAKRRGELRTRPRYQTHRVVDVAHGVITATMVGPGHENESSRLEQLLPQHTELTGLRVETVTADSKYGTADNLEYCEFNKITAYINPLRNTLIRPQPDRFTECCFLYDEASDTYTCPAGQTLRRKQYRAERDAFRYSAPAKACRDCVARDFCTDGKRGRTLDRPVRMEILDRATVRINSPAGQEHRKRRTWMMEGSFAQSVRFGYKRARWRGLDKMAIQDYLVSAVQNMLLLIRKSGQGSQNGPDSREKRMIAAVRRPYRSIAAVFARFFDYSVLGVRHLLSMILPSIEVNNPRLGNSPSRVGLRRCRRSAAKASLKSDEFVQTTNQNVLFWFLVSGFWFLVSGFWFLAAGAGRPLLPVSTNCGIAPQGSSVAS